MTFNHSVNFNSRTMEYSKMEKFHMAPHLNASSLPNNSAQEGAFECNKSITALKDGSSRKPDDINIALNLCPDGSKINISINGTTLTVIKTSLNATIGNFTININCHDAITLIKEDKPLPPKPSESTLLVLASFLQQNPLHVVLGDPAHVKATLSLTKVMSDPNAHLVTLYSNGQGAPYLSANNYNYYVAIDSDSNIQALPESEIPNANMYTFKKEEIIDAVDKVRYYLEKGENKFYLMVTLDGGLTTLHASNLQTGSLNDLRSRFRHLYIR